MITSARLAAAAQTARNALLAQRTAEGHWVGELSTSALSTATAVMALEQVRRCRAAKPHAGQGRQASRGDQASGGRQPTELDDAQIASLIHSGIRWLMDHQNADGGWGDTTASFSNISTTMLCRASLIACGDGSNREPADDSPSPRHSAPAVRRAEAYIERAGGIPALIARYGKDKTFSVPILTHCALARLIEWRSIPALPFELACLPPRFYAAVRLPVVSYALPALIAIGQVRHHFAPPRNPLTRATRNLAISRTLRVLERIQPPHGGFLEAAPLTSFVTMSLAGMGLAEHPVAVKGVEFLVNSVRPDGSWPIDTNLATWVTTLAVNALGDDLPQDACEPILRWLLDQQYRTVHPYTNAAPGGWAWTDLPGGVPDADDTAGALLALASGGRKPSESSSDDNSRPAQGEQTRRAYAPRSPDDACNAGIRWLLGLQNRDGGFPTFCRGWGTLPFDRSSADITAHCLRVMVDAYIGREPLRHRQKYFDLSWAVLVELDKEPLIDRQEFFDPDETDFVAPDPEAEQEEFAHFYAAHTAMAKALAYLRRVQRPDGSWLPLWFGNQHAADDINPTYGTARVLAAFRDAGLAQEPAAVRGVQFLLGSQNTDGGWGGAAGTPSSVEETALAVEILCDLAPCDERTRRGVDWLIVAVENGSYLEPTPIGFYFAKLWYSERLYPLIFTVAALRAARRGLQETTPGGHDGGAGG